ncbi:unnamed protein product [Nippostrongylus brasiliensis]|uniref:Lecithin-cholesterol acyltransferase-like 1 n=1 Tax=Nippostrongylus brasiliensis TaxID=27835 RepID=A0A0N4YF79_NIPBR|nr:unnamed protein product [Nippostrongylus brasiliensis]
MDGKIPSSILTTDPQTYRKVPGDGGTQMEANLTGKPSVVHPFCRRYTSDYFDLWLNMQEFLPIAIDCFAHNIMLDINPETGEVTDMPGVDVRIPGFGHTSSVEFLDKSRIAQTSYFFGMIESLVKMGYRRGMDVTAAPYDFRRAPEQLGDYYDRLKALIERTYQRAGNEKVVIVGHSLGNLVALRFFTEIVDQEWKDTYIKSHVAVAPPWGGSVKIVLLYTSGYNFENSEYILPSMGLRTAQRTFTSSAYLFPNRLAYRDDEVLATVGTKNYTLADMKTFFDEINYSIGWRQVEKLDSLNRKLPAPGVKTVKVMEQSMSNLHRCANNGIRKTTPEKTLHFITYSKPTTCICCTIPPFWTSFIEQFLVDRKRMKRKWSRLGGYNFTL